ncbi:TonB-dependent receptor [Phenylobacterium sp.]|uniref:TonB-dependent receptor n=1 Tax=Phenylobacterium sp. TaxID=1871053 RepID=UPI002E339C70|nr:TonB-dependent receptor [Phenylobacterium sp.]HEX4710873.1 TonB-dependent receptor [Phenylobacterium sp.]
MSATQKVNLDAQQEFQIPGQSLDTALLLYSRESGLQIISSAPAVANKVAQPLHGRMTPREALSILLKGSELSFVVSGSTVTIVPMSPMRVSPIVPVAMQTHDGVAHAGAFDGGSAPAPAPNPVQGGAVGASDGGGGEVSSVTVTGSRIIRNGYEAPTPVTVASVAELQLTTPSNIPDALNKLPEFTGSITQNSNSNATTGVNGNFLNLRGLGPARTLVLMDGHRIPPTSYNGTVDTNTLPQLLMQRVEVVTGGASAIYGSDAVGGVVNFILDTKFTGFKGVLQGGVSTYGDAPSSKVGFAVGAPVFGAGHVLFGYQHSTQDGLNQDTRSFASSNPGYTGAGTASNPYTLQSNLRLATTAFGGYVTSGPLKGQQFVGGGTLAPFTPGIATGSPTLQVGGDGAYYYGMQMFKPLQTDQLFGRFDYDLGHSVSAYVQVSAGWSQTSFTSSSVVLNTTVYGNNAYLPASVQATVGPNGSFGMSSLLQDLALDGQVQQNTQDITASAGLKGKFLNDAFTWDIYYAHGEGLTHSVSTNNINTSHLYAALDAVQTPGGIACRVSTTASASLYPGCVPLNIFGVGNESPAALSYIFQNTSWQARNQMDDVSATITGTAFNDWAGPVSIASNVEWRGLSLNETTTADPNVPPTLTGLRATWASTASPLGKATAPTNPFLYGTVAPQHGEESVWEVSLETLVPLLKDQPFAQSLDLDAAYRYTDYSVTGAAKTWKVGLSYQPVSDLRFRATQSHDIRAPNLFELFQAPVFGSTTITDPHTGVTGTVMSEQVGNPDLQPEVADTTTAGAVYSPSWFPRFRISIDYYHIDIANVVATTTGLGGSPTTALANCETSKGTSSQCLAIVRPLPFSNTTAANFPTLILTESINLSRQYNEGVDLETSYGFDLARVHQNLPGSVDMRLIVNYAPNQIIITNPGSPPTNAAGNGIATGRATAMLNYDLGPFKASWQTTYSGPHHRGTGVLGQVFAGDDLPAVVTHDLGLTYRFERDGRRLQAFLSVNNVFNAAPQISPLAPTNAPGQTSPAVGDTRGRYFTTGIRFNF